MHNKSGKSQTGPELVKCAGSEGHCLESTAIPPGTFDRGQNATGDCYCQKSTAEVHCSFSARIIPMDVRRERVQLTFILKTLIFFAILLLVKHFLKDNLIRLTNALIIGSLKNISQRLQ